MKIKTHIALFFAASLVLALSSCNLSKQDDNKNKKTEIINNTMPLANDSIAYYEELLSKDSMNVKNRIALAINYYTAHNYDEAIYHLLIATRIESKNLEALITLGNAYYDSHQFENAIEYYQKALAIDSKNIDVRCDMATCYIYTKNSEKAIPLLKKNLTINKNHPQTHYNLSTAYKELGKTKEAEEEKAIFEKLSK